MRQPAEPELTGLVKDLPERVANLLLTALNAEFATVNSAGVPIDTPMLVFPSEGLQTFDVCTGLAYPAKAERARRNPKVGLLFEAGRDDPVVSIAGRAAVRDRDIQANVTRYIQETAYARPLSPPWHVARNAVYYWSRILISITPRTVLWWNSRSEMGGPPERWEAPPETAYPSSDPEPPGEWAKGSGLVVSDWRELAERAIGSRVPAHFTVCDEEGYPRPIRVRALESRPDGFVFEVPGGIPWSADGSATLTFLGRETFVGEAQTLTGHAVLLRVDRPLPINPFVNDANELWEPTEDVREKMMSRLKHELGRRGQPIPKLPEQEPELTAYAKLRRAKLGDSYTGLLPT